VILYFLFIYYVYKHDVLIFVNIFALFLYPLKSYDLSTLIGKPVCQINFEKSKTPEYHTRSKQAVGIRSFERRQRENHGAER
jgi:hypothetical protein